MSYMIVVIHAGPPMLTDELEAIHSEAIGAIIKVVNFTTSEDFGTCSTIRS